MIRRRLRMKNNSNLTNVPLSSTKKEQQLRNFWQHINQYYFKKIYKEDLERIEYLINLLKTPLKGIV